MDFKIPKEVLIILEKFQKVNWQIYIVGGAVRDLLLERQVTDWDLTTDAKPDEILKLFPEGFYDNKFGTVGIPLRTTPEVKSGLKQIDTSGVKREVLEITTMRKEGEYQDFRHPEKVSWTTKIEEDLSRRDFTINAIAVKFEFRSAESSLKNNSNFEIIDPFRGQDDIKAKLIKAVGDPDKRFKEDALRLIRALRIANELEFGIEKNTFESIQKNAELITKVANERIRDELFKILSSENPEQGFLKLRDAGILQIILPEVEKCFGIVQQGPKHARVYDIGEHLLLTLKHCPSKDPLVKFAALLHDIGKPDTHKIDGSGNVTFYNHEVTGGYNSLDIAKRFNLSNKQTDKLFRLVRWHMFSVSENQTDSAIRRFIKNVGKDSIKDMFDLRIGDRLGGGTQQETSWRIEKFKSRIKQVLKKPFSISDLKVSGFDVMNILKIKPGPRVGEILQTLFEEILQDSSKNNKDYLLKRIEAFK